MPGQLIDTAYVRFAGPRALPHPPRVAVREYVAVQLILVPLLIGTLAWWCQHSALDMLVSGIFVDPASHTFAWRDVPLLDVLGHQAARGVPVLVGGIAFAAGLAGFGVGQLRPWTGIFLALGAAMLLGPLAVNILKGMTTQHCPTALLAFGGIVDYAADQAGPFWAASPQGAGRCLPSGHASGGYALLSLYFAGWAAGRPAWRWRGLAIGLVAGLAFSLVRVSQGAHFASATLWSAAVAWTICAALFLPVLCRRTTPSV
jgi:membrane-associated PAP2 superfamily phosphatase